MKLNINHLNYLDCSKCQYVSYLKDIGYPIEALYYNSLDSTDEIFNQMIKQKKSRWHFDELGFQQNDWKLVGVKKKDVYSNSLYNLQDGIKRIVKNGNMVFASVDVYHLPHRKQSYHQERAPHSLVIKGIDGDIVNILDEVAPTFSHFQYSFEEIDISYKDGCGFKHITYFEPCESVNNSELKKITKRYFNEFFEERTENYELFHSLEGLLKLNSPYFNELAPTLDHLSSTFTLLSGSRQMFANFAEFVELDDIVVSLANHSSEIAESIRNMLNKAILRNRVKEQLVLDKAMKLWDTEKRLNNNLTKVR
ncbi:BtrH N-terminal domain-containing protein [Bacillus sp. SM2101]|uniref:BtrH N-terminal domain-containing protein n=1 Tax=Bacillus sp. SM2101 TaxID=2805366 RepID=UPI001BDE080F|nr:BtrH N-terminal domain-containing protein [Bacillus sp. SM2101]